MKLHELSPAEGSVSKAYRKGRGEGSGNAGGNALSARTGRLSGGKPHGGDGLPCLRRNAPSP